MFPHNCDTFQDPRRNNKHHNINIYLLEIPTSCREYIISLLYSSSTDYDLPSRITARARFSALVQNGPGTTQLDVQWVPNLFPESKQPGHEVDYLTPSSSEVKERVDIRVYLCPVSGLAW